MFTQYGQLEAGRRTQADRDLRSTTVPGSENRGKLCARAHLYTLQFYITHLYLLSTQLFRQSRGSSRLLQTEQTVSTYAHHRA